MEQLAERSDVLDLLSDLIQLDYDAIEAYEAAIERLEDPDARSRLHEFMNDHVRHTENLGTFFLGTGRTPPGKGDIKRMLTQGKVMMGKIAGDKGILRAMKTNEDQTNRKYEQALEYRDLPTAVRDVVAANLEDERRHRAWIEERLASM